MPSQMAYHINALLVVLHASKEKRKRLSKREREREKRKRKKADEIASHRVHQRAHQAPPLEQKWRTKRAPPFLSDPGNKGPV